MAQCVAVVPSTTFAEPQAVLSKIRDRFGGNLKVSFVGGAATSMEVLNFFENIDIKILEGYGLTETSPLVTVNTPEQVLQKRHDRFFWGRWGRFVRSPTRDHDDGRAHRCRSTLGLALLRLEVFVRDRLIRAGAFFFFTPPPSRVLDSFCGAPLLCGGTRKR